MDGLFVQLMSQSSRPGHLYPLCVAEAGSLKTPFLLWQRLMVGSAKGPIEGSCKAGGGRRTCCFLSASCSSVSPVTPPHPGSGAHSSNIVQ